MAFNDQSLWNLDLRIYDIGGKVKKIQYFLTNRKVFTALKKNVELVKQENCNKKAYVLALGPSLKDVDLNRIKGDTIVVNRFFKIGINFPDFVPTYYIMTDYGFLKTEHRQDFIEAIKTYAHRGTKFILNSKLAGSDLIKELNIENVYYVTCIDGRVHPEKEYKIDGVIPAFRNVVGAAILELILMGYKDINLLGCDFNSFASTTRNHCYKDKTDARWYPMYRELFAYAIAAKDHVDLQAYAERKECVITNSTRGSLIDAYPLKIDESLYF